ncbi:response regulator [Patescibacteria group bacterium]|nr:response regulator [Patescibacteria group bacterium]
MTKKILVVDDTEQYREKYANLALRPDTQVIVASGVKEGIELALAERPEIIITDKDMPDGSGNDLAKAVKAEYNVRIAGITGGNPEDFDPQYVDARFSKNISEANYEQLIEILVNGKNPREECLQIGAYRSQPTGEFHELYEMIMAIDILAQGYIIGSQLIRGEDPIPGVELEVPAQEQIDNLFDVEADKILDYSQLKKQREALLQSGTSSPLEEFVQVPIVEQFLECLENKNPIIEEQVQAYHDAFIKLEETKR